MDRGLEVKAPYTAPSFEQYQQYHTNANRRVTQTAVLARIIPNVKGENVPSRDLLLHGYLLLTFKNIASSGEPVSSMGEELTWGSRRRW